MTKKEINKKLIDLGLKKDRSKIIKNSILLIALIVMWVFILLLILRVEEPKQSSEYLAQKEEVLSSGINRPKEDKKPLESNTEPLGAYTETTTARITCYNWTGNRMANMKYPEYGYVATSDRTIPFGTEIIIDGETFIVGDRTALWVHEKWEVPTIDIYMDDCSLEFGAERKEIIINNK